MSSKKGVGSSRNGRDSNAKYLGIKISGGQIVDAGGIIIRQRGTKFRPGINVGMGRDYTIFATVNGRVEFKKNSSKGMLVNVISG